MARRHAVAAVGGMDPTVEGADDLDLVYKLAERGRFAYLDEVTSAYRLHDHNASRDTRRMASALDRAIDAHLQRALDAVLPQHDALRLRFRRENGVWTARAAETVLERLRDDGRLPGTLVMATPDLQGGSLASVVAQADRFGLRVRRAPEIT